MTHTAAPEPPSGESAADGPPDGHRGGPGAGGPSPWVHYYLRHLSPTDPPGTLLDVACGGGRHLRLARSLGYSVTGVDRTLAAVADLDGKPGVELVAADLEHALPAQAWPLAGRRFSVVVVTNYLWRPLLPLLAATVAPGGLLLYETFARGNERYGRPSNPDFLLAPGELLDAVRPWLVPVAYEHVTEPAPQNSATVGPPRIVQRIAAVSADHKWLIDPPPPQSRLDLAASLG